MNFLFNLILGVTFGLGLILSKLFEPTTVIAFLNWTNNWDPSFLYAMIGMVLATPLFLVIAKISKPPKDFFINQNEQTDLNTKVIVGSILFGIGWSVSGLCASTATINLAFGEWKTVLFFIFMTIGFYCPQFLKKITL